MASGQPRITKSKDFAYEVSPHRRDHSPADRDLVSNLDLLDLAQRTIAHENETLSDDALVEEDAAERLLQLIVDAAAIERLSHRDRHGPQDSPRSLDDPRLEAKLRHAPVAPLVAEPLRPDDDDRSSPDPRDEREEERRFSGPGRRPDEAVLPRDDRIDGLHLVRPQPDDQAVPDDAVLPDRGGEVRVPLGPQVPPGDPHALVGARLAQPVGPAAGQREHPSLVLRRPRHQLPGLPARAVAHPSELVPHVVVVLEGLPERDDSLLPEHLRRLREVEPQPGGHLDAELLHWGDDTADLWIYIWTKVGEGR